MTAADKRPELASKVLSVFPAWYSGIYDAFASAGHLTVAQASRAAGVEDATSAMYVFKRFGLVAKVKPATAARYEIYYRVTTAEEIAAGEDLAKIEQAKGWANGTRDIYRYLRRCAIEGFAPRVCDIKQAVAVSDVTVYRAMRVLHNTGLLVFEGGRGVRYSLTTAPAPKPR